MQSTTSSSSSAPRRGGARGGAALRAGRGRGGIGTASPSAPVLLPAATLPRVEAATPRDREAIERQLGRPPRALAGVAARCPHGGPSVIAQRPYDAAGAPFPTTFWLSCRVLVRAVGELESDGGIAALERELAERPALRRSRAAADRARRLAARVARRRRPARSTTARRSPRASTAGRPARRSSACTRTPRSRSRRRPTRSARSCSSARGAATPERCCAWA